ncbi:uncharacterized protein TNCV_4763671 [Trichonephila clavipes]|nr:uncharacterized protein TNCV_4763671 [Trichonephila clavipes]
MLEKLSLVEMFNFLNNSRLIQKGLILQTILHVTATDERKCRQEQTVLNRIRSGQLRTLTFKDGNKYLLTCVRCSACQASPKRILDCLGLTKQDLYEDPLIVLDFLRQRIHGLGLA